MVEPGRPIAIEKAGIVSGGVAAVGGPEAVKMLAERAYGGLVQNAATGKHIASLQRGFSPGKFRKPTKVDTFYGAYTTLPFSADTGVP